MKSYRSYLHLVASLLTFFGACQSFGQLYSLGEVARVVQKAKLQKLLGPQKDLLIDFSKIDLEDTKAKTIQSEVREGPGSGGGGNSCALMIKQNTIEILPQIKSYPPFQQDDVALVLEKAIKASKFYIGKDLYIDGKKVEAINYPHIKTVTVEQTFCNKIDVISQASIGTLLHEFLGLAGYDDRQYQISSNFIKGEYRDVKVKKLYSENFSDTYLNSLREKFKNSKPILDYGKNLRYFGVRCSQVSEIDGKTTTQSFNFLRMSDKTAMIELIDPKTNRSTSEGSGLLNTSNTMTGIIATFPSANSTSTSYLVFREYDQGLLIGERSIKGDTQDETLRLAKSQAPVLSIAMPGTVATGYTLCTPGPQE